MFGRIGGEALAIVLGSIAGIIVGAALGFALFGLVEFLAESLFGFERSRFRGGFLVLGAIVGIPAAWWWMRRMDKADIAADED